MLIKMISMKELSIKSKPIHLFSAKSKEKGDHKIQSNEKVKE